MSMIKWVNLVLRNIMEVGIILAFGYWGYYIGGQKYSKILLCVGAPVVGFGFWGLVDFHQFGRVAEALRLSQELVISGLAAIALYATGAHLLGWALGILSIIHHILVYIHGGRLLKH